MIVPNQNFEVKWHYTNKDYYESKGYVFTKFGDSFVVSGEDLNPNSHDKILVKCDVCGIKTMLKEKRTYDAGHDDLFGDTCRKCNREKAKITNMSRFGVEWALQTNKSKEKQKSTCLKKYGVEYISQHKGFRENVKNSCLERYGVENVSQLEETRLKVAQSFYEHGTCPTSKQQYAIFQMLKEEYVNCELNFPCGRCSLDCMIDVEGIKIDIEYDGAYWHQDAQKDRRRDYYVSSQGYKILRILGENDVPSKEEIQQAIHILLTTNKNFIKINMI